MYTHTHVHANTHAHTLIVIIIIFVLLITVDCLLFCEYIYITVFYIVMLSYVIHTVTRLLPFFCYKLWEHIKIYICLYYPPTSD